MKFDNMTDNMKSTEVFFRLERCANIFSRLSSIIPRQLLAVVQTIHGELCESLVLVSKAGNESIPKKLEYLTLAERKLFYMFNSCKFVWLGEKPQRNRLLISLEEEDMKYKIVFSNGTAKIVDHPNFIKMNPRYPSFICCGRDDAECVMLQEGEESVCYNIAVQRYPEYDVVDVRAV